jgi:hypothetical protein
MLASTSKSINVGGNAGAIVESLLFREEAMRIAAFIGMPMQFSDAVGANTFVQ